MIVGAGVVGCAVAYELARRGASVTVVDDRPTGMGATQASAGMLAPFNEAGEGGALLELTVRSLGLFDDFVARVSSDTGLSVNYHRTGTLEVALAPDALDRLAALGDTLAARNIEAEWLNASGVRAREPGVSSSAIGGLLIPTHGFVGAVELTRALEAAARRHGARAVEHGHVRRLSHRHGELLLETDRGSLRGDAVVIAAGSWTGQIEIEGATARPPVKPVRGQLLQLGWTGRPLERTTWGERCYMVPWPDRTVLVGATVEDAGFDERTTVDGVRQLIDAACELVPDSRQASMIAAKAGLRPETPDRLPMVGWSRAAPGLMYATGHYRNGILLAPLTAQLVANAIIDGQRDPVLEWTSPARFGNV